MVVAGFWILYVIGSSANFLNPNGGVLGDLRMGGGRRMDVSVCVQNGHGRGNLHFYLLHSTRGLSGGHYRYLVDERNASSLAKEQSIAEGD